MTGLGKVIIQETMKWQKGRTMRQELKVPLEFQILVSSWDITVLPGGAHSGERALLFLTSR